MRVDQLSIKDQALIAGIKANFPNARFSLSHGVGGPRIPLDAIDGSPGAELPLMTYAMIDAEKLRRMNMDKKLTARLGAGQNGLSMTIDKGSPLAKMRLRAARYVEESDGSLRVLFVDAADGMRFCAPASRPDTLDFSECWKRSMSHMSAIPRFGKTECLVEVDGNTVTVLVPALRQPLMMRKLKSKEGSARPLLEVPPAGPTRDAFRDAVRVVNAFKARLGDALELRVAEDGTLRGAIMEEFQ